MEEEEKEQEEEGDDLGEGRAVRLFCFRSELRRQGGVWREEGREGQSEERRDASLERVCQRGSDQRAGSKQWKRQGKGVERRKRQRRRVEG